MAEFCDLVAMLLCLCSLESYPDTLTLHLPRLLSNLLVLLRENAPRVRMEDAAAVLTLCRQILAVIEPPVPGDCDG